MDVTVGEARENTPPPQVYHASIGGRRLAQIITADCHDSLVPHKER